MKAKRIINNVFLPLAISVFTVLLAQGQEGSLSMSSVCKKCDSNIVNAMVGESRDYSYQEICNFFCTLDSSCETNVEFSETSNEILFRVLLMEPKFSLQILSKESGIPEAFILKELSRPVNDQINIKAIFEKVSRVHGYTEKKEKVLNALQLALLK